MGGGSEGEYQGWEVIACLKSKSLCPHHHVGLQLEEKDIIKKATLTLTTVKSNSVIVMAA